VSQNSQRPFRAHRTKIFLTQDCVRWADFILGCEYTATPWLRNPASM
jgi:hypothetical protein